MQGTYIELYYFSKRNTSERKWFIIQIIGTFMKNDPPIIIINLFLSKVILYYYKPPPPKKNIWSIFFNLSILPTRKQKKTVWSP